MRKHLILAFIALAVFGLRLPFLAHGPGGWDDVDFALGIKNFDLEQMQPHFPGYPIYMLAAFMAAIFIKNPFYALSVLSALSAALTVFPLYCLVERISGRKTALWIVLFWAVNPLVFVLGTQPMSDSFGNLLAMLLTAASFYAMDSSMEERKRAYALLASGILLGLLYGVRISYIAFGAVPLWAAFVYIRDTRRWQDVIGAVSSAVLVCLLWIYALIGNVGSFSGFWKLALSFTGGHFSDWGGTYTEGGFLARVSYWVGRQWLGAGLGTPWSQQQSVFSYILLWLTFVGITGNLIRWKRQKNQKWEWKKAGFLLMWIIPYIIWAFFAQNVEKPRHILPLIAPFLWMLIMGLSTWKRAGNYLLLTFAGCMLAVSWTQIREQAVLPSPMVQLSAYLAKHAAHQSTIIYTYEEERVIRYEQPSANTVRLRKWPDFQVSLLNYPILPERIFLTNSVADGFHMAEIKKYMREAARFKGSEWLYPTYHDIILYEVNPAKKEEWRSFLQEK
ncbi:glycosyltransferase family 39 protein [Aneurinibacillus tyrosinisolvens]|uniref:glycosyltransferase family 39 protein n=1 Tax=Aneurinibacillus tyrosinisolvens TaxID=1443435 RepID=UPI00063F7C6E|nr:glycosyltransferase family 39 protein [Aneurinibacillus tyrosinisolvens]